MRISHVLVAPFVAMRPRAVIMLMEQTVHVIHCKKKLPPEKKKIKVCLDRPPQNARSLFIVLRSPVSIPAIHVM